MSMDPDQWRALAFLVLWLFGIWLVLRRKDLD